MRPATWPAMAALLLPLASGAAGGTTLQGNGVAVTLDLGGFRKNLGAGPIRGSYWRLGQFSLEPGERSGGLPLVVSVLVDEVPAGVGLDELRDHVLAEGKPEGGAAPEVAARPGGFTVSYRRELAPGFTQWNLHYHTLLGRKWIELHFSSMIGARRDLGGLTALASGIIDSVRIAGARSKG